MQLQSKLELVSFKVCPFAQRTRLVMNLKKIPHQITYIDLDNKPDWFLDRVPTGKVPALFVGEDTLFESAIINEYLDEISRGTILPEAPLERAKTRAWIALSDGLIFAQYRMFAAKDFAAFEEERSSLVSGFKQFAPIASERAAASDVSLIDAALVPVFTRLAELPVLQETIALDLHSAPQIGAWSARLLAVPEVQCSISEDFSAAFSEFFATRGSYAVQMEKELEDA